MRNIADLIQKLEDAGVQVNRLEWKGNNLDIDVTPFDAAVPVFIELGYMEEKK